MSDKKTKKPTFITVSAFDANSIVDSSSASSAGMRRAKSNGDKCWAQTCLFLRAAGAFESLDTAGDVKDIAEKIRETFKESFLDNIEDLPEQGRNARTGKTIDIADGKGDLKWSSWEGTRNSISYCGDLATVAKANLLDDLFKGEKQVMAKGDILGRAKGSETPLKACNRGLDLVESKLDSLKEAELDAIIARLTEVRNSGEKRKSTLADAAQS